MTIIGWTIVCPCNMKYWFRASCLQSIFMILKFVFEWSCRGDVEDTNHNELWPNQMQTLICGVTKTVHFYSEHCEQPWNFGQARSTFIRNFSNFCHTHSHLAPLWKMFSSSHNFIISRHFHTKISWTGQHLTKHIIIVKTRKVFSVWERV